MDTAMRDLERIREQDPEEGRARQWGVWILAALTTVALVVALGMMVGGSSENEAPADDPLAALEGLQGDEAAPAEEAPEVDPQSLTFPSALVTQEERPEVAAAVAAAGAELAHPEPVGALGRPPRREEPERAAAVPRSMPAGAAAAPSAQVLTRTVRKDPLMAAAPADNKQERQPRAPSGRDGKYTLQVISYRSPDEARVFAETLRERGHEAFVVSAEIPERGKYWRVRIGPFDSLRDAESYRADFEEAEGMNTYVVKKDD